MMRALKWLGIAVLVPILLFVLLAVLLYLPPVQNWAVKRVAAVASEKTGMEISVEHVNLEFPLNLGVEGVRVVKPRTVAAGGDALQKDTVAVIRKMVVDVQLKPLLKGQVEVDKLELSGVKLNTVEFISDTQVKGTIGKLSIESHGIDLKGDGDGGADTVHNIVDIVMSAIGMFSNDSFERSLASVDLMIKPQLQGFNLMSFDNTAIEFMLLRGWKAAESMAPQLDSLKRVIGHEGFRKVEKPAVNLAERAVLIDRVEVTGLEAADAAFVRRRLHVRDSSFVNARSLEDDIAGVYGEGVFDFINYELLGDEEPYRLRLHCQKGPVHQFGLGLRIDTEELVSALLNIGLNTNALRGLSADFTARIGSNPYLDARAAYIFKNLPTLNLGGKIRWTDRNSVVLGDNYYNISFFDSKEEIFLSGIEAGKWELLGGARNTYQHIVKILGTSVVGDYVQDAAGRNFQSLFAKLRQETLDDSYFPARGISAGVEADVVTNLFAGQQLPLFGVVSSYFRAPLTLGNFALVPKADLRFLIGNGIPLSYANVIGGEIPGRYIDQQIAFTGLNNAAFRRNCLTVGGVDLRQRFGTNHYVTLTGNFSYDFDRFSSVSAGELLWGAGLSYSYNTIAGPVKLLVHYNNYSSRVGVYFSAGLNF